MSKGFSFAQIGGTLGKDPESRSTPGGTKVVTFSVPVDKGYGDKTSTSWFNIVAFGAQAEFAEKYLKKGKSVYVTGDLQVRSWEDKTGQKRNTTEITAYKIDFAEGGGTKSDGNRSAPAAQTRQQAAPQTRAESSADPFVTEDDFPF